MYICRHGFQAPCRVPHTHPSLAPLQSVGLFMCIYTRVCVYAYTYRYTYIYTYTYIYICIQAPCRVPHTCPLLAPLPWVSLSMCVCVYIQINIYPYDYINTCMCIYVYMYICIYGLQTPCLSLSLWRERQCCSTHQEKRDMVSVAHIVFHTHVPL